MGPARRRHRRNIARYLVTLLRLFALAGDHDPAVFLCGGRARCVRRLITFFERGIRIICNLSDPLPIRSFPKEKFSKVSATLC
jgi:hypothetical protein